MQQQLPQILRADAQENRERVLRAARTLFAERGLDTPMREIARLADIGPATLYRRFPTKQALIDVAFQDELHACQTIIAEGYADTDPWRGLCSVITRITELNAHNQGFTDAFLELFPGAIDFARHRADMLRSLADLCRRARDAGQLRADFVLDDLVLIFLAGRGVAMTSAPRRLAATRRFAALTIDGLRVSSATTTLPPVARVAADALRVGATS